MAQRGFVAQIQGAFVEQGFLAAVGVFVGAIVALAIATVRRAFTNEEAVKRIEASFRETIEKWEGARQKDRDEVKNDISAIHKRLDRLFELRGGGQ